MSWDHLVELVRSEAPSLLASVTGVPPLEIAGVEEQYHVRLPEAYRQYLLVMGEDSAGFHLFGPSWNHRFRDVVARIPEDTCPVEKYFKIAYADDAAMISPPDYFLDLTRSDGLDAPILAFEGGEDFNPDDIQQEGFTFLECAYRRLFGHIANSRLPERALMTIPVHRHAITITALRSVLEATGFAAALEPLARVVCLRRDAVWAMVDLDAEERDFAISLWSRDRASLEALLDQLSVRFGGAETAYRSRHPAS